MKVVDLVGLNCHLGGKEQEIISDFILAHFSLLHKPVTKSR